MYRLVVFLFALATAQAIDSSPAVTLEHTEHWTLHSAKIDQTYDLFVSLPQDYAPSGKRYPVLYAIDGWHFPLLAFLQNNNVYSGRMEPVIMVNLGHGRGINPMPLRARDFTPTRVAIEPTSGGAAAFLDFLEHEVIPLVERSYRATPGERGLLGHSYGGLFALYALVQRPGLFNRIVAASPVADWDRQMLFRAARERLPQLPRPVRLDLSVGDDEHDVSRLDITNATIAFAKLLDELKPAKLEYRLTIYPGENHNSVRLASFPSALYWVYRR